MRDRPEEIVEQETGSDSAEDEIPRASGNLNPSVSDYRLRWKRHRGTLGALLILQKPRHHLTRVTTTGQRNNRGVVAQLASA
ncbi:hypothetical protein NL676_026134 [Syzygium grande]|nr:hypothetical protein NL676_026134 [Syzygium grande]